MIKLLQWLVRIAGLGALALGITFLFAPRFARGWAVAPAHDSGRNRRTRTRNSGRLGLSRSRPDPRRHRSPVLGGGHSLCGSAGRRGGHLAVEIVHPLLGVSAINLAEMLAAALTRAKFTR